MKCKFGCGNNSLPNIETCQVSSNSCPVIRRKNSDGLKKAYKMGKKNTKHFDGKRGWRKNLNTLTDCRIAKQHGDFGQIFIENSKYRSGKIRSLIMKNSLLEYKCSCCGISSWNNKDITLELDHINGINNDNRLDNLRFLCPNCHSQTPTYKGKNRSTDKISVSDEILLDALKKSGNIRKALIAVGLSAKGRNYHRAYELLAKNIS